MVAKRGSPKEHTYMLIHMQSKSAPLCARGAKVSLIMCSSGARRKYTFNRIRIIRQVEGLESSYEDVCTNSSSRNAVRKRGEVEEKQRNGTERKREEKRRKVE